MSRSTLLTVIVLVVVTNFALDYLRASGYSAPMMLVIVMVIGMIAGLIMRWLINWIQGERNL